MNNTGGVLNERVITKLSVQPPAAYLVQTYLEQICEKYEVDWTPTIRLTAETMGESMAPPTGFSVPIAQGTGLGTAVVATTGQTTVGDEEITLDISPKASAKVIPASSKDDFEEPDIFIPAAPGSVSTAKTSSTTEHTTIPSAPPSEQPKDDDDDNDDKPNSSNYDDLAARFDRLKDL